MSRKILRGGMEKYLTHPVIAYTIFVSDCPVLEPFVNTPINFCFYFIKIMLSLSNEW